MKIRVGQGIDVHRFKEGRKLFLGGVEIPHEKGLEGHSDADVLLHSLIDAILGAMGENDIGSFFPDNDPKWKNAKSLDMLEIVVKKMQSKSWRVINLDVNILSEEPKLSPFIAQIKQSLCESLSISLESCSVKAGTMERMGFIGRGEGMMAQSVVLLGEVA